MNPTTKTHFDQAENVEVDLQLPVDLDELRAEVQAKYAVVATDPETDFHFHTGRFIAERCGYDGETLDAVPEPALESFAGVANPWHFGKPMAGERIVDVGSGAGFDSFVAARAVGHTGEVVGIDMTTEMLDKARAVAAHSGVDNVDFRRGFMEQLPVEDSWADVVVSNGVFNLAPNKKLVFSEVWRVLRPGGVLQFADIANGAPVPEEAMRHIDLWTG